MKKEQKETLFKCLGAGVAVGGTMFLIYKIATMRKNRGANNDTKNVVGGEDLFKLNNAAVEDVEANLAREGESINEVEAVGNRLAGSNDLLAGKNKVFPEYHLGLDLPPGWEAESEQMPMPNIALIALKKPEFVEMQARDTRLGSVPAVMIAIEDMGTELLDLYEIKEKNKQIAIQQLWYISNGALTPTFSFDGPVSIGPFLWQLEYQQKLPPYDMQILALYAVKNGLSYSLQLICAPDIFDRYRDMVMDIVRGIVITEEEDGKGSGDYTKDKYVLTQCGGIAFKAHPSWSVKAGTTFLAEISVGQDARPMTMTIYDTKDAPEVTGLSLKSTKAVDDVTISTYTEKLPSSSSAATASTGVEGGVRERIVATYDDHTLVIIPTKHPKILFDPKVITSLMRSIQVVEGTNSQIVRTFINSAHGYEFPMETEGVVMCSKIGGGTVLYAPTGIASLQEGAEVPTVTIRVGDPSVDPSCCSTLEGWRDQFKSDKSIKNIENTTLSQHPALSVESQEMVETAPGSHSEVKSKFIVSVGQKGTTTLIRWEASTGAYMKYKGRMNRFFEEFIFL